MSAPALSEAEVPHLSNCTGNGSEPCWDCGGDCIVSVATSDDPGDDEEKWCTTCEATGVIRCPGCHAQEGPDRVGEARR